MSEEKPDPMEEFSLETTVTLKARIGVAEKPPAPATPTAPKAHEPYARAEAQPKSPALANAELRKLSDRIRAEREAAESKAGKKESGKETGLKPRK